MRVRVLSMRGVGAASPFSPTESSSDGTLGICLDVCPLHGGQETIPAWTIQKAGVGWAAASGWEPGSALSGGGTGWPSRQSGEEEWVLPGADAGCPSCRRLCPTEPNGGASRPPRKIPNSSRGCRVCECVCGVCREPAKCLDEEESCTRFAGMGPP